MLRILGVVGSGFMKITNILSKACACVSLTAKDKSAAITELVDLLHADG
ncbi:MAG: hypothetical protein IH989_06775, partial [Planctomycetes bacterium]|nr:hypothetical protein [Planctomycetota bacterium]